MAVILADVEIIARELDSRLMVAGLLASRGHMIIVGMHHYLMGVAERIPGCIYLGKNLVPPYLLDTADYRRFKATGGRVAHLETEGAVYAGDETEWQRTVLDRFDPSILAPDDRICAWGDFQARTFAHAAPDRAGIIHVTGNPGFAMHRPPYRQFYEAFANTLRAQYGDFILINTNFGRFNGQLGLAHVFSPAVGYRAENSVGRLMAVRAWASDTLRASQFVLMMHELSTAMPDRTIILRPHPAENIEFYRTVVHDVPNVRIVREGPVAAWLQACQVLIHDGCTTGLEAFLLGTPIINFRPIDNPQATLYLPNRFGTVCRTISDVIDALKMPRETPGVAVVEGVAGGPIPERARQMLADFEADSLRAVCEVIASMADPTPPSEHARILSRLIGRQRHLRRIESLKRITRILIFRRRYRISQYTHKKFPGFRPSDLTGRFASVERILNQPLHLKLIHDYLAVVTAPASAPLG